MFVYKAMLDAQAKRKYDAEMRYEREAYAALEQAKSIGVSEAVAKARVSLGRIDSEFETKESFKKRLLKLGLSGKFGDLDEIVD